MCMKLPVYKHDYKNQGHLVCTFTGDFSYLSHCPQQQVFLWGNNKRNSMTY